MATYTAPTTRTTGALISASIWNTDIVENLKYFKDAPVFDGDVSVGDDLLLPSTGAVINFASGDVTITHSTNTLTFGGAASGYIFNDGSVGIGVTPSYRLDVTSSAGAVVARFNQPTAGKTGVILSEAGTQRAFLSQVGLYTGNNDGNFGIFVETGYNFQIATNGSPTSKFTVTTGGNIAIGATARLYLDGVDGTGNTYIAEGGSDRIDVVTGGSTKMEIGAGGSNLYVRFVNGLYMTTWPTTANAANAWVGNGGVLSLSTSSIRYKHDIATLDGSDALAAVMAMRPVTYRGKTDDDQRRYVGFIAEEVQQWAPLLCTYDDGGESGTPNYVTYDRVTAYLVAVVQQQQTEISALKARIH